MSTLTAGLLASRITGIRCAVSLVSCFNSLGRYCLTCFRAGLYSCEYYNGSALWKMITYRTVLLASFGTWVFSTLVNITFYAVAAFRITVGASAWTVGAQAFLFRRFCAVETFVSVAWLGVNAICAIVVLFFTVPVYVTTIVFKVYGEVWAHEAMVCVS